MVWKKLLVQFLRTNSLFGSRIERKLSVFIIVFQYLITVLFYNTYAIDWFNQRQNGFKTMDSSATVNHDHL